MRLMVILWALGECSLYGEKGDMAGKRGQSNQYGLGC